MVKDFLTKFQYSTKIGLISGEIKISYKQWYQHAIQLSNELSIHCGKIVGLLLPNGIAYAVSYFACLYSEKIIAPIYKESVLSEVINVIKQNSLSILVTTMEYVSIIDSLLKIYDNMLTVVLIDNFGHVIKVMHTCTTYYSNIGIQENDLEDVVILLHTSGSTSSPKRVMLTNRGLEANVVAHCESLALSDKDVCLIQLPMMFGYCNTAQFLSHIYLGACIVINENSFMISDFYRLIERWKITNFTAVSSILNIMYKSRILRYDISSLNIVCFGGSPISKEFLQNIAKKFPDIYFIQTYGLTEAGPRVTTAPYEFYTESLGSVGVPISNVKIRIVDENGRELNIGEIGEIIVKSDGVMKGYYGDKKETQRVLKDGWLYTGDLGYLSQKKYLYIVGRKKNVIISGGINISPEEIEKVILAFPGVKCVRVYGIADELLGEKVCVDVEADFVGTDMVDSLRFFCKTNLSKYKIPEQINIVKEIPRTYNGKISR